MGAPIHSSSLNLLHFPDGSSTHNSPQTGHQILASVNGPIEVQRRDELPEEAVLEIHIRPASGLGSPKERWFESILHATLRKVVQTEKFPRTLVQVTLQVVSKPEPEKKGDYRLNPVSELGILPALLHTALLALLSANIPLETTFTAALAAVVPTDASAGQDSNASRKVVLPTPSTDLSSATSLHVFAFTAERELLLAESEGDFNFEMWERAYEEAEKACCGQSAVLDGSMDVEVEESSLRDWLRSVVREKVEKDQRWRTGS